MADTTPAIEADEANIAKEESVDTPELSQSEQDALMSAADGVDGTLTPNSPEEVEDVKSEDETTETTEEQESSEETSPESDESEEAAEAPTPDVATEKDEAGVYNSPTASDPGDFQSGDYSFSVATTDGRTLTFNTPEELDTFAAQLDDNPELISASQFSLFNRKAAVMEQGIAADRKQYETDKAQFDKEQTLQQTRDDALTQWNNEINYLANDGELPKISDELNSADWTNPEIAKEPAVKARLAIFKWMESENSKRMASGLDPIKSVIDAHNAMQLETLKQQNQETVNQEKETRQRKGSMVGGATSFTPQNAPANSIVGTGGSLDDVLMEYYNQ